MTQLVNRVVKTSASEAAKAEAMSPIEAALSPPTGCSQGQMLCTVFGNLANKPLTDPVWGQTALQFQKQLAVARYLTETLAYDSTELAKLQAVLADVTPEASVSTPLLNAQIIGMALPGG